MVASTPAIPKTGCHQAMPGGTATRTSINIGVAVGKYDATVEKTLFGSRTTFVQTNIGTMANNSLNDDGGFVRARHSTS